MNDKPLLITIFTPTYNRANLLHRLYESLLTQTFQDFEWIVVDDGSLDNTEAVILGFVNENKINITYYKQDNSGKHIAINKGVELAKSELFFIVDSDDFLPNYSLEKIFTKYQLVKFNASFAGVVGRKGYSEEKYIGTSPNYTDLYINALDFRYKYKIGGDMAEVIKTSVLCRYPFPVLDGEKFCTEGLVWNKVALDFKMLWFDEIVYIAEYQEGGLSDTTFKIRKSSPNYTTLYYSELEKMQIPLVQKIKANINYWRFAKYLKSPFNEKFKKVSPLLSVVGLPFSLVFNFIDKKK